jgi:Cd2+/Zn2+-exporting ATPase/Cu+-exporting ATPase
MAQLKEHRAELIRLGALAIALATSWLGLWKSFAPFDFIALAATIGGGYPMFKEAFEDIRTRRMTMELSMSIAVVATLVIGQFFTGLVITFFVIFAELLEHLTVNKGRNVIRQLIEIMPRRVFVRRNDGEREIDISDLKLEDVVIVKPGSNIPVDGMVIDGQSIVDQSSITGESLPVEKQQGTQVLAGTINLSGFLVIMPERIGRDTTFGKIIEIIEKAEHSRAPIQKVADALAARLVYLAFGGAVITYLFTHNILSAISALIVAGACGVAAGTPLAILAGVGRTAREGIIVKGGIYLEQLAKIDTIVLDKTGTLTLGKPKVSRVEAFGGPTEDAVLRFAASAEQHSEHPLAEAILRKARERQLTMQPFRNARYISGLGIVCDVNGCEIAIGNSTLMESQKIRLTPESHANEPGESEVFVARNGTLVGIVHITDELRGEARNAVNEFKRLGCSVVLLSGDHAPVAEAIGREIQADQFFGDMLPQKKLEKVKELKSSGKRVAMVGDGVNDVPALIEATVGIAMGAGTAVALDSSDMALVTNDLLKIVEAIRISRQCLSVIMFNFWGTVLVDLAGIVLAFLGFLTPLYAALIHVTSEMAFILNSARLFRK